MPGHQAEWIGLAMQEAMGDRETNWRLCECIGVGSGGFGGALAPLLVKMH